MPGTPGNENTREEEWSEKEIDIRARSILTQWGEDIRFGSFREYIENGGEQVIDAMGGPGFGSIEIEHTVNQVNVYQRIRTILANLEVSK